jgi:hypothetical protein
MNTDDFEKQLERQSLRQPPAAWREEILAAACASIPASAPARESELLAGWRALLARIPLAWGAVAALWLVIIGANSLMSGPAIKMVAKSSAPASARHEPMTVWNLQRAEVGLLANRLTGAPDVEPMRVSPNAPPRPRSDRRREEGFGGFETPPQLSTLV